MRVTSTFAIGLLLSLAIPGLSTAAVLPWSGTLTVEAGLGWGWVQFVHIGTGVSTVNGTGGLGHLDTIRFAGGLTYTGGASVPETIPLTDPLTPTLMTLRATGLRLGTMTFNGISGGQLGSQNTARLPGRMKLCILFTGCGHYIPIPFGTKGGAAVGVGGMITVNTFTPWPAALRLSIQGAPWTIGLASIRNVTTVTPNGGVTTYTRTAQGFVHGPASATSGTAQLGGVVQLVTPYIVQTNLGAADARGGYFSTLTLYFVPEPSTFLLLGVGVAAFGMLGRRHTKK